MAKDVRHPQLLSVTRAAERLDCSRAHVYRLIETGALRSVDMKATGKRSKTRVYEHELDALIETRTTDLTKEGGAPAR